MKVYIYQAALLCEDCGKTQRKWLDGLGKRPANLKDEASYDSNNYPKGPYEDGGGEADTPQHCDTCDVFLENPLTSDGAQYVVEKVADAIRSRHEKSVAFTVWRSFYNVHVRIECGHVQEEILPWEK